MMQLVPVWQWGVLWPVLCMRKATCDSSWTQRILGVYKSVLIECIMSARCLVYGGNLARQVSTCTAAQSEAWTHGSRCKWTAPGPHQPHMHSSLQIQHHELVWTTLWWCLDAGRHGDQCQRLCDTRQICQRCRTVIIRSRSSTSAHDAHVSSAAGTFSVLNGTKPW